MDGANWLMDKKSAAAEGDSIQVTVNGNPTHNDRYLDWIYIKLIPVYQTCFESVNAFLSNFWKFFNAWHVERHDLNDFDQKE